MDIDSKLNFLQYDEVDKMMKDASYTDKQTDKCVYTLTTNPAPFGEGLLVYTEKGNGRNRIVRVSLN